MPDNTLFVPPAPPAPHPVYRPPLGLPLRRESRWGSLMSVLVHALIILLILVPIFEHDVLLEATRGGGGPGPAGGGGGGTRGSGGQPRQENVRYFAVAAAAKPALAAPQPKPVQPPPEPVPPKVAKIEVKVASLPPVSIAPVAGTGGGTGSDGTGGTGPGTGGGIGSGVGTGTGSADGPGTGGGGASDTMIAHPTFQPLVWLPTKNGKTYKAQFVLDERGKVLNVLVEATGDRAFDKLQRETLAKWTFRPAVLRSTGAPVPSVYQFTFNH